MRSSIGGVPPWENATGPPDQGLKLKRWYQVKPDEWADHITQIVEDDIEKVASGYLDRDAVYWKMVGMTLVARAAGLVEQRGCEQLRAHLQKIIYGKGRCL